MIGIFNYKNKENQKLAKIINDHPNFDYFIINLNMIINILVLIDTRRRIQFK